MLKTNPIISPSVTINWILLTGLYMIAGVAAKNYFGYFTVLLFAIFLFESRSEYCLYLTVIWIFTCRFFMGMRYLELSGINNQIDKAFLLILLFIHIRRKYVVAHVSFISRIVILHVILFTIFLISYLSHHYNFLRIFVSLNYFLLFIIVIISSYEKKVYINLFNILLAIGFVQIPVAASQYLGIIKTPPIQIFEGHTTVLMEQGLDDVACGTFGPMASPDVSFFLTILALTLFTAFLFEKNKLFLVWGFFYLLHYLTVDSKTALGITLFIFAMVMIKIYRTNRSVLTSFKLSNIWLIAAFGAVFVFGIKSYYNTSFGKGMDFNFYKKYIKKSISVVYNNFDEWGKITGFNQVYRQQYKEGQLNTVFFGFGLEEYNKAGRRFLLKQRVSSKMKLLNYANNFMNNDSTLITLYAEMGVCGLIIILIIYLNIYNFFSRTGFRNSFSHIVQTVANPLLIGLIIFAFISFALNINSFSLIAFWLMMAVAIKLEENERPVYVPILNQS